MKILFAIMLLAGTGILNAQIDTRVNAPPPPAVATGAQEDANAAPQDVKSPQQQPALSGLELFDENALHDQLSFSGQISGIADSRSRQTPDGAHFGFASQVGGQARFEHNWRQSSILADYSGGISTGDQSANLGQNYEELGLTQLLWRGRWHFMAGGHFTYLPESDFGFNVFRSIPDVTATLNGSAVPSRTVFTQPTVQLHESAVSEVDYLLDRLSSISIYGVYSRQSFDSRDLLDSNQINATFGYNHILNPRDSIAVSYSFGQFDFDNTSAQLQTHSIQLFYAHRLGRKMGIKISAGPQLRSFQHVNGNNLGIHAAVAGSAELDYQLRRTHLNFGYLRQTTSGSGVLVGSLVDQVSMSADRQLNKAWHGALSMAYARTSHLESFMPAPQQRFDAAYAVIKLDRRLGRTVEGFISYGVQIQNTPNGASNLAYYTRHLVTIGFLFHPRSLLMH